MDGSVLIVLIAFTFAVVGINVFIIQATINAYYTFLSWLGDFMDLGMALLGVALLIAGNYYAGVIYTILWKALFKEM